MLGKQRSHYGDFEALCPDAIGVHWPLPLNDAMEGVGEPLCNHSRSPCACSALCEGTGRAGDVCTAQTQAGRSLVIANEILIADLRVLILAAGL